MGSVNVSVIAEPVCAACLAADGFSYKIDNRTLIDEISTIMRYIYISESISGKKKR